MMPALTVSMPSLLSLVDFEEDKSAAVTQMPSLLNKTVLAWDEAVCDIVMLGALMGIRSEVRYCTILTID